jgi:hypothetical protein
MGEKYIVYERKKLPKETSVYFRVMYTLFLDNPLLWKCVYWWVHRRRPNIKFLNQFEAKCCISIAADGLDFPTLTATHKQFPTLTIPPQPVAEDEKYAELNSCRGGGWKYAREIFGLNQADTHWDGNVLVYRREYTTTCPSPV